MFLLKRTGRGNKLLVETPMPILLCAKRVEGGIAVGLKPVRKKER